MLANGQVQPGNEAELQSLVRAFENSIRQKDAEATLAAWQFENSNDRSVEAALLRGVFSAQQVSLSLEPPIIASNGQTAATAGTLTQISEPRGSVEQWALLWRKSKSGWKVVSRETFGGIDGLVHLNLQPTGFVANGQSIELEDFVLRMTDGTFFLNTQDAGPTSLVFVGKGRVTFKPRPVTERGQMKIFAKTEIFDEEVTRAFLRLHPADLYRTLRPGTFADDPRSRERMARATEYFERHKGDAFVLDAPVPGAPWWLLPGLGDSTIVFETRKYDALTYSLSSSENEGVSLFNRSTARQIAAYARANASVVRDEGDRALDVVNHDLAISLNPENFALSGRDTVTVEIRGAMTSFRFHLDDDLEVKSVRSQEGGRHLFFRVRGQDSVLVSMGSLAGRVGRLHLTVDYAGRIPAGTVESEILQTGSDGGDEAPAFTIDPALIYSKRRSFYPHFGDEDYATSTLSVTVPQDWNVVSGGARTEKADRVSRTVTHQITREAKYLAFLVARISPIASERMGPFPFDAFGQSRTKRDAPKSVTALKSASQYYANVFGPIPYSPMNLALVEAQVPGGHSPPGLVILQQRPPLIGGSLKDDPATFYDIPGFFLAHELAHQWWGHGVTPRSYRDRWVSEAFAQYAAALWSRESLGEETFVRVLRKMATWGRRMTAAGPVDLGNRVGHIRNDAQAHRAVVYDKGAMVIDMVRRLVGEDAFRRALIRVQRENRFRGVDSEMIRRAFEAESGMNLEGLWEVFVRNTSLPTMRVEVRDDGQEIVVDGFTDPLPVAVRVDDRRLDLVVTGRLRIPGATARSRVTLDPDSISLVTAAR